MDSMHSRCCRSKDRDMDSMCIATLHREGTRSTEIIKIVIEFELHMFGRVTSESLNP